MVEKGNLKQIVFVTGVGDTCICIIGSVPAAGGACRRLTGKRGYNEKKYNSDTNNNNAV